MQPTVYISYNMGNQDLPDIYAHALGPPALGLGHIHRANPSCPCYNLYIQVLLSRLTANCKILNATNIALHCNCVWYHAAELVKNAKAW